MEKKWRIAAIIIGLIIIVGGKFLPVAESQMCVPAAAMTTGTVVGSVTLNRTIRPALGIESCYIPWGTIACVNGNPASVTCPSGTTLRKVIEAYTTDTDTDASSGFDMDSKFGSKLILCIAN